MTKEQIINQLESLKEHCEDFVDRDEEDSVWEKDVEALGKAIEMLKEHNKESNDMVEWKEENMEERVIVLKRWVAKTYVRTDAPSELIEEAIDYLYEIRGEEDLEDLSDFEIVQKYVEDRQYTFEETEEDCEKYWW